MNNLQKPEVAIFGANGVIGQAASHLLEREFSITAIDVQPASASKKVSRYVRYRNSKSLDLIYDRHYYAVVHMQQIKSPGFMACDLSTITEKQLLEVMNVNLFSVLFSCQKYINTLAATKDSRPGRIINLTSTYGVVSSNPSLYAENEMGNPVHYTLSKFGVTGLTKYIASYYKKYNVLCNCIAPHGVENKQSDGFAQRFGIRNPIGRLSKASEVIPAIRFLLDQNNTYTNGAVLMVDGGWTAC